MQNYISQTLEILPLIGAIAVPALESYLYPFIISLLFIEAHMDALYTIVLKIGIGQFLIILIKLFGKIVHYIENIIRKD
jgi:hypothetical protein